jgi:hypothetical protein
MNKPGLMTNQTILDSPLITSSIEEALSRLPEYGSISLKFVFHQGEIIRVETTKSVSEKF